MFGHDDTNQDDQQDANVIPPQSIDGALAADAADDVAPAAPTDDDQPAADEPVNPALPSDPATFGAPATDPDPVGSDDTDDTPTPAEEPAAPVDEPSQPANEPTDVPAPEPSTTTPAAGTNDLLDIKQQALQQLSPLVDHLDQSPEEKFRTTMMMIQASDDQSLVKAAYEAALSITDEKAKAQALLDIVNEINYFTHQQTNE